MSIYKAIDELAKTFREEGEAWAELAVQETPDQDARKICAMVAGSIASVLEDWLVRLDGGEFNG